MPDHITAPPPPPAPVPSPRAQEPLTGWPDPETLAAFFHATYEHLAP